MSTQVDDWVAEFDAFIRNGLPKPGRSMAPMRYYGGKGMLIGQLLSLCCRLGVPMWNLMQIRGQCMLSGYSHPVYNSLEEAGWEKHQFETVCRAAGRVRGTRLRGPGSATEIVPRIECLWIKRTTPCLCD